MRNRRKYKAAPENADGDFYVVADCCTLCGVPGKLAPELFGGFDEKGRVTAEYCWVKKQPENKQELDKMIDTVSSQELGCIRYCGKSEEIKKRLKELNEGDCIDN